MVVLVVTIFIMTFANQNDITNVKISSYSINNDHCLCQLIKMIHEINNCVARIEISSSLPDSASGLVHVANYVMNNTFIHLYSCTMDDYDDFAFYGSGICYFHLVTQIPTSNAITTFSLYPVTTSIIQNRVPKEDINKLYFIALLSAVFGILVLTQASFIFNSSHDQEDNNGNTFEYRCGIWYNFSRF